jgi:hypothetical protein
MPGTPSVSVLLAFGPEPAGDGGNDVMCLGSAGGAGRLATHLLGHFLLHFRGRRFSHMRGDHPGVAIGIDDGSATVAPKHVHNRRGGLGSEFYRLADYLVHVLDRQV